MIHKIAFSNFFSFKEKIVLDFTVDKNAPDTEAYFTDAHENRISKITTIIGANASGKTTLLKSIVFLKWFITNSFTDLGPNDSISPHFNHFLFCSKTENSTFEIVFEIENDIYAYELELNEKQVITEKLDLKNIETKRWNTIFSRKCDPITQKCDSNFARFEVSSDFEKIVRHNSSVISAAKQVNNTRAIKIAEFFSRIQSNVVDTGFNDKFTFAQTLDAAEFFGKNPVIRDKAEKILRRFDLGISNFTIAELKNPQTNDTTYIPMVHHKNTDNDQEQPLMMMHESGGTQNLFVLLKDVLAALETGDVVVFDELDNNLHPLMIPEIINLFISKKTNPRNAQLIFSTHNVQILSELDKQQIVIVEKDAKNVSQAWRLSDIEGVRADENYYTKYLAGIYGGIPKL